MSPLIPNTQQYTIPKDRTAKQQVSLGLGTLHGADLRSGVEGNRLRRLSALIRTWNDRKYMSGMRRLFRSNDARSTTAHSIGTRERLCERVNQESPCLAFRASALLHYPFLMLHSCCAEGAKYRDFLLMC